MDIFTSVAEAALAGASTSSACHPELSAAVVENTPPTTPDDSGASSSGSPSPQRDADNFHTLDGESTMSADSEDNSRGSAEDEDRMRRYGSKPAEDDSSSSRTTDSASSGETQQQKSATKRPGEEERLMGHGKRAKKTPRKTVLLGDTGSRLKQHRVTHRGGRDGMTVGPQMPESMSAGMTMSSSICSLSTTTATTCHRPSKFTFDLPLDDGLDADRRIAVLQDRLAEIRKVYMSLKAEVAVIDRRRKRAKKKESGTPATPQTPTAPTPPMQAPLSSGSSAACSPTAEHPPVQLQCPS